MPGRLESDRLPWRKPIEASFFASQQTKKYRRSPETAVESPSALLLAPCCRVPARFEDDRFRTAVEGTGRVEERPMQPDLELVHIRKGESFAAWMHGYPFRTVRWHYHPEYELHLIVATSGRYYIGDFAGTFSPGQLIMTGPNLPQNWISDIAPGELVPVRSIVIQFPEAFVREAGATMAEMGVLDPLLERSRRGLLFDEATSAAVAPLMRRLVEAQGLRRLALFWEIMGIL